MSLLSALAGRLLSVAMVGPAIARMKRRIIRAAVGGAIVAVLGTIGLTYLLIAVRAEVERHLGPVWTPAAMGAALLVLAGIAYFVFLRAPRAGSDSGSDTLHKGADAVRDNIAGPARQVQQQIAQRPLPAMVAALSVGFAAASLLRMLRRRTQRSSAAEGRPAAHTERDPEWTREVVFREAAPRGRNGKSRKGGR